jgi:hypothetical protein
MEIELKFPGDTECEVQWNSSTRTLRIKPKFWGFVPKEIVGAHIAVSSETGEGRRTGVMSVNTGNGATKLYRTDNKTVVPGFDETDKGGAQEADSEPPEKEEEDGDTN